jgi:hypothetical protein
VLTNLFRSLQASREAKPEILPQPKRNPYLELKWRTMFLHLIRHKSRIMTKPIVLLLIIPQILMLILNILPILIDPSFRICENENADAFS